MGKNRLLSIYDRIRKFNKFCVTISGLILLFVTFSIFVDVILRYFFNRPSIWVTEVSAYLLLYMIFLGTAYALQQGLHIKVTFIVDRFGAGRKRILNLITAFVSMAFCFVLLWQTSVMTWTAFKKNWVSPTMLNAPYVYIYVIMVFGSLMLLITLLLATILEFKTGETIEGE